MKNSTEHIIFRSILALSVICILAGIVLYYLGSIDAKSSWKIWNEEIKKSNSPQFTTCIDQAIKDSDKHSIDSCYTLYGSNVELLRHWSDQAKSAQFTELVGIILLFSPILLILLFYIFRWIFAGRWRAKQEESSA